MNRVCALSVIFLVGSLAGIAQTLPSQPAAPSAKDLPAPTVLRIEPYSANSCPAGIEVKEQGIPRLLYIKAAPPQGPAISLRILVSNSRRVGISSVRIAVRGYTQSHLTPMSASGAGSGEVAKTFRVSLQAPPGGTASAEIRAGGFVSVTSVELTGVAYADGSTWRAANNRRCRISSNLRVTGVVR